MTTTVDAARLAYTQSQAKYEELVKLLHPRTDAEWSHWALDAAAADMGARHDELKQAERDARAVRTGFSAFLATLFRMEAP